MMLHFAFIGDENFCYKEPFDVVYDVNSNVVETFTSYE